MRLGFRNGPEAARGHLQVPPVDGPDGPWWSETTSTHRSRQTGLL